MQKAEAVKFKKLKSEREWPRFIVENGYSHVEDPSYVSSSHIDEFRQTTVPLFDKLNSGMDYAAYQDEMISEQGGIMAILKNSFGILDIVFFGLGIATAFKIGNGVGDEFA